MSVGQIQDSKHDEYAVECAHHHDEDQLSEGYHERCYQTAVLAEPPIIELRQHWTTLQAKKAEEMLSFLEDQELRSMEKDLVSEERRRVKTDMRSVKLCPSICNYEVQLDFLQNAKPSTYPVLQNRVPKERASYCQYHNLFHEQGAGSGTSKANAASTTGVIFEFRPACIAKSTNSR
jgi:hypothetical protein